MQAPIFHLFINLSIHVTSKILTYTHQEIHPVIIDPSTYASTLLYVHPLTQQDQSIHPSVHPARSHQDPSIFTFIHPSTHTSTNPSKHPLSIDLSLYPSSRIHPSTHQDQSTLICLSSKHPSILSSIYTSLHPRANHPSTHSPRFFHLNIKVLNLN